MQKRLERLWSFAQTAAVLAFCLFYLAPTSADPDLWGHVRFGKDIIRDGVVHTRDPYSYLSGSYTWINHEWLMEVLFGWTHDAAGAEGLLLLKAVCTLLLTGMSYLYLRRCGLNALRSGMLVIAAAWALRAGLGTIRPQLATYVCFFLTLVLVREAEHGRRKALWALPPLFALWANCHGGFLAGAAVFAAWWTVQMFQALRTLLSASSDAARDSIIELVLAAAASAAATLLTPYGTELIAFLLRTATVPRPEITEWSSLRIVSAEGLSYLTLLAIACFGVGCSREQRRPALVLLLLLMAAAPFSAVRHLPLFAISVIVLAGPMAAEACNRLLPSRSDTPTSAFAPVMLLFAAVMLTAAAVPSLRCIDVRSEEFSYPTRAVALVERLEGDMNMAVLFDWGEFVIWHLGPRVKVSIDGRRETVYSEEVRGMAFAFEFGREGWDQVLRTAPVDLALVHRSSKIEELLQSDSNWVRAYEDELAVLFANQRSPAAAALPGLEIPSLPSDGQGMCFP